MLGQNDINYINNHAYIYDQNWRMYKNFLGEPYLIKDCLVYYDGCILYICAFSLHKGENVCILDVVDEFLKIVPSAQIDVIDVWGICSVDKFIDSRPNALIFDYTPQSSNQFDSIIDIKSFSLKDNRKARLAYNAFKNKGIQYRIVRRDELTYQHLKLMENFIESHDLKGPHSTMFLSMGNIIREPDSYVVESYIGDNLLGFGIIMKISIDAFSYCLACYDNSTRASDATLYACIEFCKKNNFKVLHLGYSASESLLRFKNKWGGSNNGIEYEEYFISLSKNKRILSKISNGKFLWRDRFFLDTLN